jgi:hypothetical protein
MFADSILDIHDPPVKPLLKIRRRATEIAGRGG